MPIHYDVPKIIEYVVANTSKSANRIAEDFGIDPGQFSRYRNGKVSPSPTTLDRITSQVPEEILSDFILNDEATSLKSLDAVSLTRRLYGFGEGGGDETIYIIPATAGLVSEYKDFTSANHIKLDNFSDRDAILQIALDLARTYPERPISPYRDQDFHSGFYGRDLVLVGSRGVEGGTQNNICADAFLAESGIDLKLTREAIKFRSSRSEKEFKFDQDETGYVKKDVAVAVKFRNPFDETKMVFHFFGHFTWGGTAIAQHCSHRISSKASLLRFLDTQGYLDGEFLFIATANIRRHTVSLDFDSAFVTDCLRCE